MTSSFRIGSSAWRRALAPVVVVGVASAACGSAGEPAVDSGPTVAVTTALWADVVDNVVCDGSATIETVIPPGGDPHTFEASAADRARLERASLVVANGLLLEEGLDATLDAVADAGTPTLRIGDHIDQPLSTDEDQEEDDDHEEDENGDDGDDGHGHDGADPHVWFDPVRVAGVLPELAERLVDDAGLDRTVIDGCLAAYQAELESLDAEIQALVSRLPESHRRLVTNHDALGYFADRYGFTVVGTVIPSSSTLAETNPAALEELAATIEAMGVTAIFTEAQASADVAGRLADQVGVEVVELHTGTVGEAGSGADSYIGLLRTNAQSIVDALS